MNRLSPTGKCFAEFCDECHWYKFEEIEEVRDGKPTGVKTVRQQCRFELMLNGMHFHMGSLDGLQQAVNEARNRSLEVRLRMENFGNCMQEVLLSIGNYMRDIDTKLLENLNHLRRK